MMRNNFSLMGACALAIGMVVVCAESAESAGVVAPVGGIVIDGRLDESSWAKAEWKTGFSRANTVRGSRTPVAQTSFALLADSENIYFGAKAAHPAMENVRTMPPAPCCVKEAVEVYFVPDGGTFDYYQFLMAFDGTKFAMYYSEGGNIKPDPFGPLWDMKTVETDGGWSVEARIPLSAFYMTRAGKWKGSWRINSARCCRNVTPEKKVDYSCWADGKGFSDVPHFPLIGGFPARRAEDDVFIKSVIAEVKEPNRNGGLDAALKFSVFVDKPGSFEVKTDFSKPVRVNLKRGDNEFSVPAVLPGNGRILTTVALTRDGGRMLGRTYPVLVDYQAIRLKLTSPEYRGNFYPGQDSDRVSGRVVVTGDAPVLTLEGPGFGRQEVKPGADGAFSFDTRGFVVGTATLTVRSGADTLTRKIRKLAPLEGGHTAWVEKGRLIVDGKPVFRRNMYAEHYLGGAAYREKYDADELYLTKDIVCNGLGLEPGRLIPGMEQKEAVKDVEPCAEIMAKVAAVVEKALKSKSVYYYISDEPECRGVSPVYLKHIYDYVCEHDPYHVVLTCSRAGEKYIDCADWFETHPYINPHLDSDGKRVYTVPFNRLGSYVDDFRPADHPDKCIGGTPACFAYANGDYPTFREYLANFWCEMLRGARTMYPFYYTDLGCRPSLYEGTRYAFSSIAALETILLNGERKTLAKTSEYEAALWTMPSGERMFAIQNFTGEPLKVSVPGLSGEFKEFRGNRKFNLSAVRSPAFELEPLESLIGVTGDRGRDLPTFAATQAKIDALEAERVGRDNQLLDIPPETMAVTTSRTESGTRNIVDGVRDVLAWNDTRSKAPFYEISFSGTLPRFDRIRVYGRGLEGMSVKIRAGGEWRVLTPAATVTGTDLLGYDFGEKVTTVKLRIEFPKNGVELYEIELPGRGARESVLDGDKKECGLDLLVSGEDCWRMAVPKGATNEVWRYVKRDAAQRYVVFEFKNPRIVRDGKYTAWGIYLTKGGGRLAGQVVQPLAGYYTLQIPEWDGKPADVQCIIRNYNLALDMSDVVCPKDPPKNRAEFTEADGTWTVLVTLDSPCEDVTANFLYNKRTIQPFDVGGRSSIDLKPLDATCRVWSGEVPARAYEVQPFLKVTVLGGRVDKPIYTWLHRKEKKG